MASVHRIDDVFVAQPRFMGVITPSGNTVVERVTMGVLRAFPAVTPLFSRTPVFGASDPYPQGYGLQDMLGAARLLAHAGPEVLVWNGSKGAKIGIEHDRAFCAQVEQDTGIRCTTSILALEEVLRTRGIQRIGLVSPYDAIYQAGLVRALEEAGYEVVAERHAALADNLSFASIEPAAIEAMVRDVAAQRHKPPEAVIALCTNFPAAPVLPALEAELGISMFDSVSLGVWHALRLAGIDTSPGGEWGRVFTD